MLRFKPTFSLSSFIFIKRLFSSSSLSAQRRQWHPTPVLVPGKSHGRRSLVGCSPWGRKELDMTEQLHFHFTFMHWRRKWQPTPVFLPRYSHVWRSLVGYSPWGRKESDMTEQLHFHFTYHNNLGSWYSCCLHFTDKKTDSCYLRLSNLPIILQLVRDKVRI